MFSTPIPLATRLLAPYHAPMLRSWRQAAAPASRVALWGAAFCLLARAYLGCGPAHQVAQPAKPAVSSQEEPLVRSDPPFVVQIGHAGAVTAAAFFSEERRLVTGGADEKLKIWDLASGALLRTLRGHAGSVTAIQVLPGGKTAIVGSKGREQTASDAATLALWDLEQGRLLRRLDQQHCNYGVEALAVSKDTRWVALASYAGALLCDVDTGARLKSFNTGTGVTALRFSDDGTRVYVSDRFNGVSAFDTASGRPVPRVIPQEASRLRVHELFPNSPQALHLDQNTVTAWDLDSYKILGQWDLGARVLCSPPLPPQGKQLLLCRQGGMDLADSLTGKTVRQVSSTPQHKAWQVSPEGHLALTGEQELEVWRTEDGTPLQRLDAHSSEIRAVAQDAKGNRALSAGEHLWLWDLRSARLDRRLSTDRTGFLSVVMSADGKRALSGRRYNQSIHPGDAPLEHWNLDSKRWDRVFLLPGRRDIASVAWSAEEKVVGALLNTMLESPVRLVFPEDQHRQAEFGEPARGKTLERGQAGPRDSVRWMAISPSGQQIVVQEMLHGITFLDSNLQVTRRWPGKGAVRSRLGLFSPDGKRLLVGHEAGTLLLFEADTGRELQKFSRHQGDVVTAAFSADGSRVVSGAVEGVRLWETSTGRQLRHWGNPLGLIESVAITQDGNQVLAGSLEGATRVLRVDTGAAVNLVADDRDWLVYSDDGYFDASPRGGRLVAAVRGGRAYRIDQLAVRNNRPDILLERMGWGTPEMIAHYRARHERRVAKLGLSEATLASSLETAPVARLRDVQVEGKTARLSLDLTATTAALLRYQVYVNDVPVLGEGKQVSGKSAAVEERVELGAGRNKIEASVVDASGTESLRDYRVLDQPSETQRDLYYLGFGVSRYADSSLNLAYAHKDALDLAEVFRKVGKGFRKVHVQTYVDEQATVANLKKASDFLRNAGVDDILVLFIGGHGVHSRTAQADYFFVTHEVDVHRLEQTAASFELIEELLASTRARQKLLLLDTCESGERDPKEAESLVGLAGQRGFRSRTTRALVLAPDSKTRAETRPFLQDRDRYIYNDLSRRTGAIVFSSSRGTEVSLERDDLQNGLFTEEILIALTGPEADQNKDGRLSTDELRGFVAKSVAEQSGGLQNPTVDRDNLDALFAFPLASEARSVVSRKTAR